MIRFVGNLAEKQSGGGGGAICLVFKGNKEVLQSLSYRAELHRVLVNLVYLSVWCLEFTYFRYALSHTTSVKYLFSDPSQFHNR